MYDESTEYRSLCSQPFRDLSEKKSFNFFHALYGSIVSPFCGENMKDLFFSNFQVYNAILSTVVIMLYVRSPELTHLIAGNLYPLTNICHFPSTPSPWHPPLYSLSLGSPFLDSPYKWNHTVFLCFWFISLSMISSRFIYVVTKARFPSFCG